MVKKRNISIDFARIIAVLAVIMIHCSAKLISIKLPLEFAVGNFFDAISRIAVPLFVMISGALMLDETRMVTVKKLITKNIKTIVIMLFIWSMLYSLIYNVVIPLQNGEIIKWSKVFKEILLGHFHLWYLYMIIGLYLITPFLRTWVNRKNAFLVLMFIGISLIFQFTIPLITSLSAYLSELRHLITFLNKFNLGFFGIYTCYFLTGWYIVHIGLVKRYRFVLYSLSIFSLAFTLFYVYFTKDYGNGYSNGNIFTYIYSTGVFLAINRFNIRISVRTQDCLKLFSNLTFGVYIVHIFVLDQIVMIIPYTNMPVFYVLIIFCLVSILSFGIVYLGSRIPIVKNAFRM